MSHPALANLGTLKIDAIMKVGPERFVNGQYRQMVDLANNILSQSERRFGRKSCTTKRNFKQEGTIF